MYVDKDTFQQIHEFWGSMDASTSAHVFGSNDCQAGQIRGVHPDFKRL